MRRMHSGWMTGGLAALVAAGAWMAAPAAAVAQEADEMAAEAPAAPPEANPADVESIDAIMTAVYDVISGDAGEKRDWDRFRSLFIPEARLIPSGTNAQGQHGYRVWSPDEYVAQAGDFLEQDGFFEDEANRVVQRWADIAHVFSTYNSYHTSADMEAGKHFQRGINSFQLMYDGTRWWVVSIMWEAEAPNRPLDEKYLSGM